METDFLSSNHCVAMEKVAEQTYLKKNALYASVLKLYVILLIMEGTEKSETHYYFLSYWDRLPNYSPCCS